MKNSKIAIWETYNNPNAKDFIYIGVCSNCKHTAPINNGIMYKPDICPNCKAKMRATNMEDEV